MRTFLCFLWIVMSPFLFTESFNHGERGGIFKTIRLLHELGHKACPGDVENAMSDRFTSLPKKKTEVSQALNISYNYIFELFKKNRTHCHWKNNAFRDLMEHLNRQTTLHLVLVPGMSSELETLVENFRKLDQFLTQQSFSCCAWETARQDVLGVMEHFTKMTRPRRGRF